MQLRLVSHRAQPSGIRRGFVDAGDAKRACRRLTDGWHEVDDVTDLEMFAFGELSGDEDGWRLVGGAEQCFLPGAEVRARFLD